MDDVPYGLGLVGLAVLMAVQALFSASEIGFLAISPARARHLRDAGSYAAALIILLKKYRPFALAALLFGITGAVYEAEHLAVKLSIRLVGESLGPPLSVVVLSMLVVVFAEVTPICWAAKNPVTAARLGAWPIAALTLAAFPIALVMAAFSVGAQWVLRRIAGTPPAYTEDELKTMIDEIADHGEYAPTDKRMLKGILDFGDQTAAQVLVPRPDMVCVQAEQTLGEALDLMIAHRHSRLPVYGVDRDDIIGVLYAKDLLPYIRRGETNQVCRLVARPPLFVPESLPIDRLLRQLHARRRVLAIVKDEYGGTAGLVTVEDLLEQIVGPIHDEYDQEEPEVRVLGESEWSFDATVNLHEVRNYVASELPEDEFDSLAGLLLAKAERIPQEGERFTFGRLEMIVERMDGQRIDRVRVIEHTTNSGDEAK
ncbi:MAG: hemolysin family protein [Candidatus Zipacnadales bacterium]